MTDPACTPRAASGHAGGGGGFECVGPALPVRRGACQFGHRACPGVEHLAAARGLPVAEGIGDRTLPDIFSIEGIGDGHRGDDLAGEGAQRGRRGPKRGGLHAEACGGHSAEACGGHSAEACGGHSAEACGGHSAEACGGHSAEACARVSVHAEKMT